MTTRTRNSIRLNSKDLQLATEIAVNSNPCKGSLKEIAEDGKPGEKASYCILGTVAQAVAIRRHLGFDTTVRLLDAEAGILAAITSALGDEDVADQLEVDSLVDLNDADNDFLTAAGNVSTTKLRNWQVSKLKALTKAVQKAEAAGTSNRQTNL